MKILYLTLESPFDPALVVRGNAIRARGLIAGLEHRGFEVAHVWRAPYDGSTVDRDPSMYDGPEQLADLIGKISPDIVIAGYWNLVFDLPDSVTVPVIVDFIAPRPLEALFEDPDRRDTEMRRLLRALERAQGFVVAGDRTEHLLIPYLLMAGHDLRQRLPVARVPIAAVSPYPDPAAAPVSRMTFVGGGVEWPWRHHRPWFDAVADEVRRQAPSMRFVEFGGNYPRIVERPAGRPETAGEESIGRCDLTSHADYSGFLTHEAQIGLELAERNIERYFSQSFRVVDYLSHGLPVICNRYLSIAEDIEGFDAGWTVTDIDELRRTIRGIASRPGVWAGKSANALRLVHEKLNVHSAIAPLAQLIDNLVEVPVTELAGGGAFISLSRQDRVEFERLRQEVEGWDETRQDYERTIEDLRGQVAQLYVRNHRLSLDAPSGRRPSLKALLRQTVREAVRKLPKPGADRSPGNVVMVTRSDLYPTDHGAAVRIVETARGLSLNGHEVGIVSDRRDVWWHYRNGELHDRRFPRWLGLMGLPPGIGSLFRTNGNFPRSNAFLYLPLRDLGFTWRALYVARFLNANVYQAEFPAFVQPCLRLRSVRGGRVVAVEHNVEYERLRDQDPDLTDDQYLFLKDVEVGLCNLADAVVCVSDDDRRRLSSDGVNERLLRIIPHGVDLEGFRRDTPWDIRGELDLGETGRILAYHGTFEYPPNLEAVKVCAREVLPRLVDRGLDVHLVAIGKHAPPEPIHPRVHFVGSVGRVAQWLKGAEVAVVPLMSGGGTRMKIIDYFASGVPVVSTSKGIEGIPVESGREAFVEDDWDAFCDRIEELLTDEARRVRMVLAAEEFVRPLDWTGLAKRYVSLFQEL